MDVDGDRVTVHANGAATDDSLTVVRAVASAVWESGIEPGFLVDAGDDVARQALERWSLV